MNDLPLFDTHQHLLMTNRWPYAWTAGLEPLDRGVFDYDRYVQAAQGTGIAGTLFMESTPDDPHWKAEAEWALSMAGQPGSLVRGVIANCRPEDDSGFDEWVEAIRSPWLKGFRRILHMAPEELSVGRGFVTHVRKIGDMDLTFDMCFLARQLPTAIKLARRCDNTRLIVDHCGVPDIASGEMEPWRTHIRALADMPHVACKISGLLAYCPPGRADLETVRPYMDHCLECFGWERLVWGGDWPVCLLAADLNQWVQVSRQWAGDASDAEQRQFFYANAARMYRIDLGENFK